MAEAIVYPLGQGEEEKFMLTFIVLSSCKQLKSKKYYYCSTRRVLFSSISMRVLPTNGFIVLWKVRKKVLEKLHFLWHSQSKKIADPSTSTIRNTELCVYEVSKWKVCVSSNANSSEKNLIKYFYRMCTVCCIVGPFKRFSRANISSSKKARVVCTMRIFSIYLSFFGIVAMTKKPRLQPEAWVRHSWHWDGSESGGINS